MYIHHTGSIKEVPLNEDTADTFCRGLGYTHSVENSVMTLDQAEELYGNFDLSFR